MDSKKEFIGRCREANRSFLRRHKCLIEYQRNSKNQKVGVVIAFGEGSGFRIGYSKCNVTLEKFDKQIGLAKAIQNAYTTWHENEPPNSMRRLIKKMLARSNLYFKTFIHEVEGFSDESK